MNCTLEQNNRRNEAKPINNRIQRSHIFNCPTCRRIQILPQQKLRFYHRSRNRRTHHRGGHLDKTLISFLPRNMKQIALYSLHFAFGYALAKKRNRNSPHYQPGSQHLWLLPQWKTHCVYQSETDFLWIKR